MLKFIFIFFLLSIKIFTQSNIDPKIAYFRENFYSSSQIIKNTKVTKIINKEGVDYFLDLNLKLLNSIKNNDFKNIKELINKGVDVRTGIYYAARENKIDILKELFKFDKIDFNNEIYFIPKDFFIDDRKWIENIKIYKNNFFIVYENYNQNLKSVLENVNLMDISTIKLLLENSFNSSYVNHELMFRLFNIISQTEDIEKIKLLINFFEINLFDQYLNISLFKEIIKNSKNDIIKYFMKNLTSEDYKKLNNLYTPMDIIFEYSLNLNGKKNFRLNLKEIFGYDINFYKKLYEGILKNDNKIINETIKNNTDVTMLLNHYLSQGDNCKLEKDKNCVIKDRNCDKLGLFLKFNINYENIYPYSTCKNNKKYEIFNKIKNLNKKQYENTAIIDSIYENDIHSLEYLLSKGANPNIINLCGGVLLCSALDLAIKDKKIKMIELLKKYNAQKSCEILKVSCKYGKILNFYNYKVYDKKRR